MSTRPGEPSVGMIPRIAGGLDSTGCSDQRTSLAGNSGATCCPGITGPPQRLHTIGGKLLGGCPLRLTCPFRIFERAAPIKIRPLDPRRIEQGTPTWSSDGGSVAFGDVPDQYGNRSGTE